MDIWSPCELGEILSDISANRGRILGLEVDGKVTHIEASCPYREFRTFGGRLKSVTNGRGKFTYRISHYARVPTDQIPNVIQESPFRKQVKPKGVFGIAK